MPYRVSKIDKADPRAGRIMKPNPFFRLYAWNSGDLVYLSLYGDIAQDRFCLYEIGGLWNDSETSANSNMLYDIRRTVSALWCVNPQEYIGIADDETALSSLIDGIKNAFPASGRPALSNDDVVWIYENIMTAPEIPNIGWDDRQTPLAKKLLEIEYGEPFVTGYMPDIPGGWRKSRYFCPESLKGKLDDVLFPLWEGDGDVYLVYLLTWDRDVPAGLSPRQSSFAIFCPRPKCRSEQDVKEWAALALSASPDEIEIEA